MLPIKIHSRRRFLQTTSALAAGGLLGVARPIHAAENELIVRSQDPYNAEPPASALVAGAITPVKAFYVRNHGEMPKIDLAGYKLRVEGLVEKPLEFTLAEIKDRFQQQTVEATLTCAGNRRQEMSEIKSVPGVQWDAGAIGNARWSGPRLSDVLAAAGVKSDARHVWFEGLDPIKEKDGSVAPFGGSIPLSKALGSNSSLLASAMNGEPLTKEHGSPLRAVVPGYIGARSVKWLAKITLSNRPSPNHYLAEAYKVIQSESKDEAARAEPIYGFPVNAAICSPAAGAHVKAGSTVVAGYALPSGGQPATIAKVEVSADGGKTWKQATLDGRSSAFNWQLWSIRVDLAPGKHDLVARATDSSGNTMPEKGPWNLKGYLYNGWHHVKVEAA